MRAMQKRGRRRADISSRALTITVLVVVVLLITIGLGVKILRQGDENLREGECRSSIIQHSDFVRFTGELNAPPINCEPRIITIDNGNEEKAKKAIADQLVFCWERWQQGQVELFKNEGMYCNPCSIVTFNEKNRSLDLETVMDEKLPTSTITYRDYLFPTKTAEYKNEVPKIPAPALDTSKEYAIVFVYDKNHSSASLKKGIERDPARAGAYLADYGTWMYVGGTIGAGIGLIAGGLCAYGTAGLCGGGIPAIVTGAAAAGSTIAAGVGATLAGAVTTGATVFGGIIGAATGGKIKRFNGVAIPEWMSMVVIIENNGTVYKELGCTDTVQASPGSVGTAERI